VTRDDSDSPLHLLHKTSSEPRLRHTPDSQQFENNTDLPINHQVLFSPSPSYTYSIAPSVSSPYRQQSRAKAEHRHNRSPHTTTVTLRPSSSCLDTHHQSIITIIIGQHHRHHQFIFIRNIIFIPPLSLSSSPYSKTTIHCSLTTIRRTALTVLRNLV